MDKSRAVRLGLIACLFAFVLGARWAIVDPYTIDLPEWDQWDAEGTMLLAPWYQGHLTFGALFIPQNEHRVVLTKLVNLGLTAANGQWDQRLEAAVNASVPGLIAVGIFLFGIGFLDPRWTRGSGSSWQRSTACLSPGTTSSQDSIPSSSSSSACPSAP